MEGDFRNK